MRASIAAPRLVLLVTTLVSCARLSAQVFGPDFKLTGSPAAISSAPGQLDVFARAADRNLHRLSWRGGSSGGWLDWADLGCCLKAGSGVAAATQGSGREDIIVRGDDDAAWYKSCVDNTCSAFTSLGGQFDSDLAAVSWGSGRIDVVGKGRNDRDLWHLAYADNGWSTWKSIGCCVAAGSGAAITSLAPGRLEVFVRGEDNNIWHKSYANGAWASSYTNIGAPPGGAMSDPEAVSYGGQVHLYVRGADDAVWQRYMIDSPRQWGPWSNLGNTITGSPAVASHDGCMSLFARYTFDNKLQTRQWCGSGWNNWSAVAADYGNAKGQSYIGPNQVLPANEKLLADAKNYFVNVSATGEMQLQKIVYGAEWPLWKKGVPQPSGAYSLLMDGQGRLCISSGEAKPFKSVPTWCTPQQSNDSPYFAAIQGDGNLCIYRGTNPGDNRGNVWCSGIDAWAAGQRGIFARLPLRSGTIDLGARVVRPEEESTIYGPGFLQLLPPGRAPFERWQLADGKLHWTNDTSRCLAVKIASDVIKSMLVNHQEVSRMNVEAQPCAEVMGQGPWAYDSTAKRFRLNDPLLASGCLLIEDVGGNYQLAYSTTAQVCQTAGGGVVWSFE
jgi:hypothetical protein